MQFKPSMLSSLLWAYATLSVGQPPLLEAAAKAVLHHLPQFQPPVRPTPAPGATLLHLPCSDTAARSCLRCVSNIAAE